jgi:hypothetical protein
LIEKNIIPRSFAKSQERMTTEQAHSALKIAGYDGVVYLNRRESVGKPQKGMTNRGISDLNSLSDDEFKKYYPGAHDSYIVFNPEQIKSFTGNVGTYGQRPPTAKEVKNLRWQTGKKITPNDAYALQMQGDIRFSLEEPSEKDIAQARSEYRKSKAHNLGEFFDHLYRQGIPLPEVNRLVNAHILAEKYPTGHGEQRLSKFAQRMKNRFEDFEFVLADQPQYLGMNMGISRAKAEKLAQNDPVMARRITFGMANAPADVANFHVGIALISQLEAQGKFDEAAPLISALSRQATRKGQEIAALRGNINDFDPLRFVQRTIARRRIARSGYFRSGEKATQTAIENITKHLQAALEASNLTAEEVSNYIKKITCVT